MNPLFLKLIDTNETDAVFSLLGQLFNSSHNPDLTSLAASVPPEFTLLARPTIGELFLFIIALELSEPGSYEFDAFSAHLTKLMDTFVKVCYSFPGGRASFLEMFKGFPSRHQQAYWAPALNLLHTRGQYYDPDPDIPYDPRLALL